METKTIQLNRRAFVKGAAAGGLGTMASIAGMGAAPLYADETVEPSGAEAAAAEPASQEKLTFEEVQQMRSELIDSITEDFVQSDGTVIPAVYVKLRTLINSLGVGVGTVQEDDCYDFFMRLFSEDDAQAYLEMPRGKFFTATDFAYESGRPEDECLEICEDMASRNLLFRARRAGVPHFHIIPVLHGLYEYGMNDFTPEWIGDLRTMLRKDMTPYWNTVYGAGSPFYYTVPASADVVEGNEIMMYDDVDAIIRRNTKLAVAPCQCRLNYKVRDAVDDAYLEKYPLETCIATGEEAEYYIENGLAREITQEEALEIIHNAVRDSGMVLQHCYTKASEIICCCEPSTCGPLGDVNQIMNAEEGTYTGIDFMDNQTHYFLNYTKDDCIACGACVERCPMKAIAPDEEGYPVIGPSCVGCGQCALVCPQGARILKMKDKIEELPDTMVDDINMKAEYRFRMGKI